MARWCARCGAQVAVADTRGEPPQLAALRADVPSAQFISGAFAASLLESSAIRAVFVSPGLSPAMTQDVMAAAAAQGLWTGGELSLFSLALADLSVPPEDSAAHVEGGAAQAGDAAAQTDDASSQACHPGLDPGSTVASDNVPDAPAWIADQVRNDSLEAEPEPDTETEPEPEPELPGDDEPLPVVIAAPEAPTGYAPKVLAITGTNGKTTVTSLTGQLVERAGKSVAVAGNIGPTLLDTLAARLDANDLPDVWVIELSSFQLNDVTNFEPTAATVLNLTQDHLDWHGSMQAYGAAKAHVFGERGLMLLNREDPLVMAMLPAPIRPSGARPPVGARAPLGGSAAHAVASVGANKPRGKMMQRPYLTFGADMPARPGDYGIETVNGMAWLVRAIEADETRKKRKDEEDEIFFQRLMPADALRIRGRHNAVNALAALALANAAGCALGPMLYGLREYRGEPHRVEAIGTINQVEYFDDSKGTNVGATVAALYGLGAERKVVVILGGEGKGQDFAPLAAPVARHARGVVLIGRDAPLIRAALAEAGVPLVEAADMQEAVAAATRLTHAGDAVLMSPACASFDMFKDYVHRADVFVAAVKAQAEQHGMLMEGTQ
ncbi:MAG: UDP-N-acetylmuramoyl-L-alanine--D-glutamate ligase [Burkholderiaceae bacterium]|nr:UDP-N-acetylmuramoyl-L-alanine--D-glutamate ligase [Burkholderiaceae bacterium]